MAVYTQPPLCTHIHTINACHHQLTINGHVVLRERREWVALYTGFRGGYITVGVHTIGAVATILSLSPYNLSCQHISLFQPIPIPYLWTSSLSTHLSLFYLTSFPIFIIIILPTLFYPFLCLLYSQCT